MTHSDHIANIVRDVGKRGVTSTTEIDRAVKMILGYIPLEKKSEVVAESPPPEEVSSGEALRSKKRLFK